MFIAQYVAVIRVLNLFHRIAPGLIRSRQSASTLSTSNTSTLATPGNLNSAAELVGPHSAMNSSDSLITKRRRGKSKGTETEKLVLANGKIAINVPASKGRPIEQVSSAKFSSELGIIARSFVPAGKRSWKQVSEEDKAHINECIGDKFIINDDAPHVKRCTNTLLANRLKDYKCKLHKKWKEKCEKSSVAEARRNPPNDIEQSDWELYCNLWEQPAYQEVCLKNTENRKKMKTQHVMGSKSFVVARHEMPDSIPYEEVDFIKFYEHTHKHEKNGWASSSSHDKFIEMERLKANHPEMTSEQIFNKVLGAKSGSVPGLGFGPRPENSSSRLTREESSKRQAELMTELEAYKSLVQKQQEELETH